MKAISEFQTNPKEAMIKYGNNKEVMEGLQEFCKLMGGQFQTLAKNQKKWYQIQSIVLAFTWVLLKFDWLLNMKYQPFLHKNIYDTKHRDSSE